MALLFCDSFDHYATADLTDKWTAYNHDASGGEITIDSGTGRTSNALKYNVTNNGYANGLYITPRIGPTGATAILGFALKVTNVGTITNSANGAWFTPYYSSTDQMRVSLAASGLWQLRLDTGNQTPVATSSGSPITSGSWAYVEIKWVIGASGTVTIRVNGTQTLAYSGDTMNGTTAGWSGMGVFGLTAYPTVSAAHGHGGVYVDDLVLMDGSGSLNNDFIGDVTVAAHFPNANGATSGWTRSTGADDYVLIDEAAPNDDTDYLSTETLDAVTTVGVANAPAGAEILGVQVNAQVKKTGVGSPALASVVRHSGTDYPATGAGVASTGYLNMQFPYDANPGTGVAWTESGFNDAEFGVKKTA